MAYTVILTGQAEEQVATLPRDALVAYLGAHVTIAVDPWSGRPAGDDDDGRMRVVTFGPDGHGMVIYLVLDRDERAYVVRVLWAG